MEQTHHYIKLPSKHRLHYAQFDKTVEGCLSGTLFGGSAM